MLNKDRRYIRYQNDAEFHHLVKCLTQMIDEFNFTHEDLRDACFVAYMRHLELNPIPLSIIRDPNAPLKRLGDG